MTRTLGISKRRTFTWSRIRQRHEALPATRETGSDEEGLLVFDDDRRLVAVLTRLSDQHEELSGHWFLEAGFGHADARNQPTFADIEGAQDWIMQRLSDSRLDHSPL